MLSLATPLVTASGNYTGSASCPCINTTGWLASSPMAIGLGVGSDYGSSSCFAWDYGSSIAALGCDTSPLKVWCPLPWCYVDRDSCRIECASSSSEPPPSTNPLTSRPITNLRHSPAHTRSPAHTHLSTSIDVAGTALFPDLSRQLHFSYGTCVDVSGGSTMSPSSMFASYATSQARASAPLSFCP